MSTEAGTGPAAVARAFLDAFARRDIDAALALLTEDVVWHVDGAVEVPSVGLYQGRHRIKGWIECFPDAFESRGFRISPMIETSTEAIVPGWFRYLVRPTGRTVEGDFTMHFTVRDGLIHHYRIVEDSLALAQAFEADMVFPPGAHRVRLNETVYDYDDTGEGPVMLFLPDPAATRPNRPTDTHRCVSVGLPRPDRPAHTVADDLALLIREKNWQPVTVVAHGRGAPVARRLAVHHPDLVE
jgi:ketosteroid isomerase-like protein